MLRGGFTGGEGAEYDRGDLAVLSTVQVAGEQRTVTARPTNRATAMRTTAYCSWIGIELDRFDLALGESSSHNDSTSSRTPRTTATSFERKTWSVAWTRPHSSPRSRCSSSRLGAPDCPTSAETDTSAQFSESCVRSIVRFPFAWPHLLDDYQDPFIEFTSSDSFDAGYYSRLPRVHARLQLSVSQHDPRPDPSFYERESAETINGVAVTFQDQSVRADSARASPARSRVDRRHR